MNRQPLAALWLALRLAHPNAFRFQPSWQWAARLMLVLFLPAPMSHGQESPPAIDFRNYIPGALDAPVYRADGTTRLSGTTGSIAELWIGTELSNISAPVPSVTRSFGIGEQAGYFGVGDTSVPVVLPFTRYGDRVWVWIRVREPHQGGFIPENPSPPRFIGYSEPFSIVLTNAITPLIGLKSFQFQPARIWTSQQGGQLVLRWSAGDGTVLYDLEEAFALDRSDAWRPSSMRPVLDTQNSGWGPWVADWVVTNALTRPATFYRIKLLNP